MNIKDTFIRSVTSRQVNQTQQKNVVGLCALFCLYDVIGDELAALHKRNNESGDSDVRIHIDQWLQDDASVNDFLDRLLEELTYELETLTTKPKMIPVIIRGAVRSVLRQDVD